MTITTREQAFNVDNVTKFKGYDVDGGEVSLSDSEYEGILNELYGEVSVCGGTYGSGSILVDQDPTMFNCMKGDYEYWLQTELEDQLECEDESDIEFEVDPDEIGTYSEGEEARENGDSFDYDQSSDWKDGWNDKDEELSEAE